MNRTARTACLPLLALLLLSVAGCQAAPASAPGQAQKQSTPAVSAAATVGTPMPAGDRVLTVVEVQDPPTKRFFLSSMNTPEAGQRSVAVLVELENRASAPFSTDVNAFSLTGGSTVSRPRLSEQDPTAGFASGWDLDPGAKTRQWLLFSTDPGSRGLTLVFNGTGIRLD